jgi:membrane fusion protein, multidrug efflux system
MKENVSSQLVAECAQKESDMMKVERIEHSAGNNSRTEALSHGQAATLRLARSELPQKKYPPAREQSERTGEKSADEITHFSRRKRWTAFALLPIALIAGAYWYVTGGQIMWTDDAYVEADKVGISTDVSGIVQDVDVTENQHVKAGQVLYRLDPRQFQSRSITPRPISRRLP